MPGDGEIASCLRGGEERATGVLAMRSHFVSVRPVTGIVQTHSFLTPSYINLLAPSCNTPTKPEPVKSVHFASKWTAYAKHYITGFGKVCAVFVVLEITESQIDIPFSWPIHSKMLAQVPEVVEVD